MVIGHIEFAELSTIQRSAITTFLTVIIPERRVQVPLNMVIENVELICTIVDCS